MVAGSFVGTVVPAAHRGVYGPLEPRLVEQFGSYCRMVEVVDYFDLAR